MTDHPFATTPVGLATDVQIGGVVNASDSTLYPFGPRRDTLYVVVPITVIYVSIFLTGIVGNVSTCIVIARNKSMHTATNYYLFSLAVSDLLLLLSGLPAEIYMVWSKYPYVFGEGFCIMRGLAAETSTNATVLTITAFTIERYVAICHPFLSQTMSKLSRAVKLILLIWLTALSFAIPQALQFGIVEHRDHDTNFVMCTYKTVIIEHSFELSTFLFFMVPMILISVLYALIGIKLRKSNMMKSDSGKSNGTRKSVVSTRKDRNCRHHTGRSSRRVLKMLVAVVVAFFICWAPFHVQRLIAIYGTDSEDHVSSNSPWMEFLYLLFTYVSGVLYYVSTSINPILYNIMSNKFREAFMETLVKCCRVPGFAGQREQRSYSSLSRSAQRTPGIFGCRTGGGTAAAQDSTDCSGNSGHDESIRQTSSIAGQTGISITGDPPCEVAPSTARRPILAKRTLSGHSTCRAWTHAYERESPEIRATRDTRNTAPRGRDWRNINGTTANSRNHRLVEVSPSGGESRYRAKDSAAEDAGKLRRIFEWLSVSFEPTSGRLTCSKTKNNYDGSVVVDIKDTREEYSMTACNISNSSLRDVDINAIDDELSTYTDEVHIKELRTRQKASDNG